MSMGIMNSVMPVSMGQGLTKKRKINSENVPLQNKRGKFTNVDATQSVKLPLGANFVMNQGPKLIQSENLVVDKENICARPALNKDKPELATNLDNTAESCSVTEVYGEHSYSSLKSSIEENTDSSSAVPEKGKTSEELVRYIDRMVWDYADNPARRLGIAQPLCACNPGACLSAHSQEEEKKESTIVQDNMLHTMLTIGLDGFMLRYCLQMMSSGCCLSPILVHTVIKVMKETGDPRIVALAKSVLTKLLILYPPCSPNQREYYIAVLDKGQRGFSDTCELTSPDQLKYWGSLLTELQNHFKAKGVRTGFSSQIETRGKRRSYLSFSPPKKSEKSKEKDEQSLLSYDQKTERLFAALEFFTKLLEEDFVVWHVKTGALNSKIDDREACPLIVLALWKQDETVLVSENCRVIFNLYAKAWDLGLCPKFKMILARMTGLIAEVITFQEQNNSLVYPNYGDSHENIARRICDAIKLTVPKEHQSNAVAMLRPSWLRFYMSSVLLGVAPSLSSVEDPRFVKKRRVHDICMLPILLQSGLLTYHVIDTWKLVKLAGEDLSVPTINYRDRSKYSQFAVNYVTIRDQLRLFYQLRRTSERLEHDKKCMFNSTSHLLNTV